MIYRMNVAAFSRQCVRRLDITRGAMTYSARSVAMCPRRNVRRSRSASATLTGKRATRCRSRSFDLFVKVEFESCIHFLPNSTFPGHFFGYFFVKLILIRTEALAVFQIFVSHFLVGKLNVREFASLAQTSLRILFQALVLSSQSSSTISSR